MIFHMWQLQVAIIAVLAFAGYYLLKRFPKLRQFVPIFVWLAKLIRFSFAFWKFRKSYRDASVILHRYSVLLETIAFSDSSKKSKEWFSKFVVDTYNAISDGDAGREEARRVSNAVYVLLMHHGDLLETFKQLDDLKNLDVKRATVIGIDFLGELVNIEDRMDRIFYQDMVYGLNKVLLILKNGDRSKKTISDVSGTIWRMYQIVLAYKEQRSLDSLTENEFKKKLEKVLSNILEVYSGK